MSAKEQLRKGCATSFKVVLDNGGGPLEETGVMTAIDEEDADIQIQSVLQGWELCVGDTIKIIEVD